MPLHCKLNPITGRVVYMLTRHYKDESPICAIMDAEEAEALNLSNLKQVSKHLEAQLDTLESHFKASLTPTLEVHSRYGCGLRGLDVRHVAVPPDQEA